MPSIFTAQQPAAEPGRLCGTDGLSAPFDPDDQTLTRRSPMDIDSAQRLLELYVENACRILRAGFGLNAVESTFFDVIELLREHPELKGYLLARVGETFQLNDPGLLDERIVPGELIELLAHEMRWDELRTLAAQRVEKKFNGDWNFAVGDLSTGVIEAFASDWQDRMFYERYTSG